MNLIKWDSFRELEDVSKRLSRIFGQPLARTETDSAYLIKGEIPGVKKEDVKVTVQDGMLNVMLPKSAKAKPKVVNVPVS